VCSLSRLAESKKLDGSNLEKMERHISYITANPMPAAVGLVLVEFGYLQKIQHGTLIPRAGYSRSSMARRVYKL
jgi:hypothetical protein